MNINKALEHLEWKFKHSWRPTKTDVEAYNSIVEYKELQESRNLSQNENLAKLWIHQMILLSNTDSYSGTRCIEVIDEILTKSVYDWSLEMKEQLPMMNFRAAEKIHADDEVLLKALKYTITEANIIKFVEGEVTRIINKFEK
jgi:hypothetical protein